MLDFKLKRIGVIMEPRVGDPNETEGVLNPAAMRGRDAVSYTHLDVYKRQVYTSYAGKGGIPLDSVWKRLLFAWNKADINILLTSYLKPESRRCV